MALWLRAVFFKTTHYGLSKLLPNLIKIEMMTLFESFLPKIENVLGY